MAEYIPPPETLFSVKIVDGQFVVEYHDDSGNRVPEEQKEHLATCLNNFETALAHVSQNENRVISQLLLSNTCLSLCLPNIQIKKLELKNQELELKIQELELSLAPLRHQLAAYQFMLGTETAETDEPSQQATDDAPSKT